MRLCAILVTVLVVATPVSAAGGFSPAEAEQFLDRFEAAVEEINRAHAASPGKSSEAELAKKLPRSFSKGLVRLIAMEDEDPKWEGLARCVRIAAELDLAEQLDEAIGALSKGPADRAAAAGIYLSRPRFLLHGVRVRRAFAERFAEVLGGMLGESDRVFGFAEFSKVPGKKLRVELHREEKPDPPHFAPQFRYHSTIDFPVASDDEFRSPTPDGKFYFYGLGHELGHVMAMWGDRRTMEDHHAWAHYVGIVLVDAGSERSWAKGLLDRRWRSVEVERKRLGETPPISRNDRDGVLGLLLALHREVGPGRIGVALNRMEEIGAGRRINRVRYYGLNDLEAALTGLAKSRAEKRRIADLFE